MKDIREIFDRMQEHRKEQRELSAMIKDSLRNSHEYHDLTDQINRLKAKKSQIALAVTEELEHKLALLKTNIKDSHQLMSDIALTKLMKGESVTLTDAAENEYEPIFSVRFKKAGFQKGKKGHKNNP
jgi:hypothetical protein